MTEKRKPETSEQKDKRKRDRELNDLCVVLSTPEGRRVIWRLMAEGMVFKGTYVHGDNGYGTSRLVGRQEMGQLILFDVMEAKPESFTQMQREHASESKREEMEEKEIIENTDILKPDV